LKISYQIIKIYVVNFGLNNTFIHDSLNTMKSLKIFLCLCLFSSKLIGATDGIYFHSNWGFNYAMNSVLSIKNNDGDIVHKASWEGRSFIDSPYYTVRLDNWNDKSTVGIEWVHYKMYLKNPPSGIDNLSISDGYNILFFNIGKRNKRNIIQRVGAGIIVAHPDVTLTGRERFWNKGGISGAYISGLAIQASFERWVYETNRHIITSEIKLSSGYARIPISNNSNEFADIPHIALHVVLGIGSKPLKIKSTWVDYVNYFIVPTIHHYSIYRFKKVKDFLFKD